MAQKIAHIGIAVKNLDDALKFYRDVLGLKASLPQVLEEQQVKVVFLPVGESKLELLEPTGPESPVARFLDTRGEGIHHLAVQVDDIDSRLLEVKAAGGRLIDKTPRPGAGGTRIAFIHPKTASGVLLELCQKD
jgi:methylmalonyl-CoA epimerase